MTERFCVLTTGRAGSTALMAAIAASPAVAVPSRVCAGWAEELLNARFLKDHAAAYGARSGRAVGHVDGLVDAFFEAHRDAPYAGFKLLPKQHADIDRLLARGDLRFITLARTDRVATVASAVAAELARQWHRAPGRGPAWFRFGPEIRETVRECAVEIAAAHAVLDRAPDPICLIYEDFCRPGHAEPALDRYFGRPIRLAEPRAPSAPRRYVGEWPAFEAFVRSIVESAGAKNRNCIDFSEESRNRL